MMKNKYFRIEYNKELSDTLKLVDVIKGDGWINGNTVLVNCDPNYSSRLVQLVNHKLSYLNKNELFDVLNLEMPYPNMSQVYDNDDNSYKLYDRYLADWINNYIGKSQYLFLSSAIVNIKNFNKLRLSIRQKLDDSQFRIAAPYYKMNTLVYPDYSVQPFDDKEDGGILFEWENMDNPNWDY